MTCNEDGCTDPSCSCLSWNCACVNSGDPKPNCVQKAEYQARTYVELSHVGLTSEELARIQLELAFARQQIEEPEGDSDD